MNTQTLLETIKKDPKLKTAEEWVSILSLESVDDVRMFLEQIEQLKQKYEIVVTQKGKLQPIEQSDFIVGKLSINLKGFGFVDGDNESIYISKFNLQDAMHGDKVLVKPKRFQDGSSEGEIVKILERANAKVVARVVVKKGKLSLISEDNRIASTLEIVDRGSIPLVDGQIVVASIVSYGDPLKVKIIQILGHTDDPGIDITAQLVKHDVPSVFPSSVIDQVNLIPSEVTEMDLEGRIDHRNKLIFTIDGEDAKDFDDAIAIEKKDHHTLLYVHIADVSHYVKEHSPLDESAYERGTSIYLVDRVVPMLPHTLSNGICSLMEAVDRLTLCCQMEINEKAEVVDYAIYPSIIRSSKRMTYTQVNHVLKDEDFDESYLPFVSHLKDMHALALNIRQKRAQAGAIDFHSVESKFILNKKRNIIDITERIQDEAEKLIEDFMVLANETVAKHMMFLDLPSIYRVHDKPDEKRFGNFMKVGRYFGIKLKEKHVSAKSIQSILKQFKDHEAYGLLNDLLIRSMAKAVYDHRCLGHFGLGLKEYCHFTSPIRRYPDLIVHRMLRKHSFEFHPESLQNDATAVEEMARQCSSTEVRSVETERDVEAMKKAEFMERHVGNIYSGIISSVTKFGFFVRLENTVEGLVHVSNLDGYYEFNDERYALFKRGTNQSYRLGQKVRIRVLAASKANQTIDFIVV